MVNLRFRVNIFAWDSASVVVFRISKFKLQNSEFRFGFLEISI